MTQPQADGASGHRELAYMLAAVSAVGPFCIDSYLPSMSEISRVFGIPMIAVQQTLTAYMVPFAVMTVWHGAISDAVGRRAVMLSALGLFTLASVGCACSTSIGMLLVFRALQGMTAGTGMVVGRAIVRDLRSGAEAQRMMSLVSTSFALAPAVAPVIGGWLQHTFGWRSAFAFMALFAAVVGVWCWFRLPESHPMENRQPFRPGYLLRSYVEVLVHVRFNAASAGLALCFAGFFIYVLSAPMFLMTHLHLHETQFIWLFGPLTAGTFFGAWLSGRVAGRLSPRRTVALGLCTMAAATAANLLVNVALPPSLPWSVVPLFFYSFGSSIQFPSLTLMALDLFPTKRGLAASCQSFVLSANNSITAAVIAPLFWASPMLLAVGSAVLFALGAVAVVVHLRAPAQVPIASTSRT